MPELMTTREVSELFRVHPVTLRRWEERGKLRRILIGSRFVRYRREDIERLLNDGA